MSNIIKVPFGKKGKKDGDGDIPDDQIPSVLLCAGCGNSLFLMLMMPEGDIAPVCQHCQLEFGYTPDGEDGIVVQEDYEEIGIKSPDDEDKE
jgi:hypothetical protein